MSGDASGMATTVGLRTATMVVGGKTYTLTAPTMREMYVEMEGYVRSTKGDPLEAASRAVAKLPASQHAAIWETAMRQATDRTVSAQEVQRFAGSPSGDAYGLLICLRKHHAEEVPDLNTAKDLLSQYVEEKADAMIKEGEAAQQAAATAALAEIQQKLALVTGEADAKNSSGRSPSGPAQNQEQSQKPS